MARKRLGPIDAFVDPFGAASTPPKPAPIAHIAGEAALEAAQDEVFAALETARREERFVEALPLTSITQDMLLRDRVSLEEEAFEALKASLRARGQRTPIEVVRTAEGYGLVSGMRRLAALRALEAEDPERFGTVKAFVRPAVELPALYQAMVEENEIRAAVSFFEQGRLAAEAVACGVFSDLRAALQGMFGNVSRAKRSKIGSFAQLYERIGVDLLFGPNLSEKLGLALLKALRAQPEREAALRAALGAAPQRNADQEREILQGWLRPKPPEQPPQAARSAASKAVARRFDYGGVAVLLHQEGDEARIELIGSRVSDRLFEQIKGLVERS